MSRDLSSANQTAASAAHVHLVTLVFLDFDTPLYIHSGIGSISYDGNTYLGVGDYGSIAEAKETEALAPTSLVLTLSGVDNTLITEAQEAGRYKDAVSIYEGYRQDDGTLVADPWLLWGGWFEYAGIQMDEESTVTFTCHHDLSVLTDKDGSRFSDEDQHQRYATDNFFQFVTDQGGLRLMWGGTNIGGRTEPGGIPPGGRIR